MSSKNLWTKKQCERRHARVRALERYNLALSRKDILGLVSKIRNNEAVYVEKQSNRVSVYRVFYGDTLCKAVYDKDRHEIITFLPLDKKDINWLMKVRPDLAEKNLEVPNNPEVPMCILHEGNNRAEEMVWTHNMRSMSGPHEGTCCPALASCPG